MLSEFLGEMSNIELIIQLTKILLMLCGGIWVIVLLSKINNNLKHLFGE